MLFHVVNDRYLSGRSMIFTTNKKLTDWGAVLHDHDLAAAIVDRLLELGRIIALDGPSMRSQHLALDEEINPMVPHQLDRVSGTRIGDLAGTRKRYMRMPYIEPGKTEAIARKEVYALAGRRWEDQRRIRHGMNDTKLVTMNALEYRLRACLDEGRRGTHSP